MSQSVIGHQSRVRWHRAAADPGSAACALGFGSIVLLGFPDGGYYETTWLWAGLALAAVAGIRLLTHRGAAPGRLELVSLTALAALATWMLMSSTWGLAGTEAIREAERCTVYVAGLAALLLVAQPSSVRMLLTGVLGGVVALGGLGLVDRALSPPALDPYQGSLLTEPVGYANALGLLMAVGVVLALGLLRDASGPQRGALVGAACVSAVALVLTSSRGAWLAALVGLGVLAAYRWRSPPIIASLAFAAVVLAVLAAPRVSLGDRPAYWSVAVADASDHVVVGSGAGSFDDYWREHRPIAAHVRDAHSLYLETAAELGVVGLALLLCTLGTPLVVAVRGRTSTVAPAAAAYSAFLVHAGLDWDWEMPVTTIAGLACGAALLVNTRAT